MKTIKKITAIILAVILCAAAPVATAAAPTDYMLCDTDGDKVITATDARKILRISAKLDEELPLLQIDADNDFQITASDARLALRTSAKLAKLTYGYNADGMPNVLDTLRGGVYSLVISYDGFNMTVYVNHDSFFMPADPFFGDIDPDGMMSKMLTDMGLLFTGGNIYLLFTDAIGLMATAGTKCYMSFDEESLGDMGGDGDDMAEIGYLTEMFRFSGDEEFTYKGTAEMEEKSYELFSCAKPGSTKDLYVGYNGKLSYISYTQGDAENAEIIATPISYVGSDVSGGSFTIADRELVDLSGLI